MASGWVKDGTVQEQIDANVEDEMRFGAARPASQAQSHRERYSPSTGAKR